MYEKATIDWLSITRKVALSEQFDFVCDVCWILGGEWKDTKGGLGYSRGRRHASGATILWDGTEDMGVHLVLNSDALAYFSEWITELDLEQWQCSRIDIAVDVSDVTVSEVIDLGEGIVSRSRERVEVRNLRGRGHTLYIGSPKGRKMVRVYDKAAEDGLPEGVTLTRIEVQLRDEYARAAWAHIIGGGSPADVLARSIDFRESGEGPKRSWKRLDWWVRALSGACFSFVFPKLKRVKADVFRLAEFIHKYMSVPIAKCKVALGDEWLHGVVFHGCRRLDVEFYASG